MGCPSSFRRTWPPSCRNSSTRRRDYAEAAQAQNTSRAYASDWKQFTGWCDRYQLQSLPAPAAVVALYLTSLAKRGLAVSPIRRRAAAIARAHRQAGHLSATGDSGVLTSRPAADELRRDMNAGLRPGSRAERTAATCAAGTIGRKG
jgi:hypothetical protein